MCPSERMLPAADPLWICCLAVTGPIHGAEPAPTPEPALCILCQLTLHASANGKSGKVVCFPGRCQPPPAALNGVAGLVKASCRAWWRGCYKATNGACGLAENRNINAGTPSSHKVSLARNNEDEDDRQRPSCRALRLPVAAVNIINSNNSSYYLMSPSSGPAAELSASQTLTPPGREALLSHFSDGKFQEMV